MEKLWNSVLEEISTKISKASFETWLKSTTAEMTDNIIFIKAPNSFARDWIEKNYKSLISITLYEITGKTYELMVVEGENRTTDVKSDTSYKLDTSNTSDKLINLIKEQGKLLRDQQERIDSLEKRVSDLELKHRH